jgi:putative ABC transport system permease protein
MWGGSGAAGLEIEGRLAPSRRDRPSVAISAVSPGYFRVMGVKLLAGRDVTLQDTEDALKVVVISESLARRHFAGENPIGRRLNFGREGSDWFTIVGIVGDVRLLELRHEPEPTVYFSFQQFPIPFLNVLARTTLDPANVLAAVRTSVHELDRELPSGEARSLREIVAQSAAEPRFRALILGVFASLALILAAVGVYGVISQSVARRVPEIGIRIALGASPAQMVALILRQGVLLALAGLGVGLAVSLVLTRLIASLLFGVEATDPATFGVVSLLLLLVAVLASYLPARRALKIDPVGALRTE